MKFQKHGRWNTLKYDAWTGAYFHFLPSFHCMYEPNSINTDGHDEYTREVTFTIEFLCAYWTISFGWDIHKAPLYSR